MVINVKVMTTLFMNEELKRKSERYAEATGRSLSGLIRYLLQKEIDELNKTIEEGRKDEIANEVGEELKEVYKDE